MAQNWSRGYGSKAYGAVRAKLNSAEWRRERAVYVPRKSAFIPRERTPPRQFKRRSANTDRYQKRSPRKRLHHEKEAVQSPPAAITKRQMYAAALDFLAKTVAHDNTDLGDLARDELHKLGHELLKNGPVTFPEIGKTYLEPGYDDCPNCRSQRNIFSTAEASSI